MHALNYRKSHSNIVHVTCPSVRIRSLKPFYVKNSTIRKNSKIGKEENQECIFYMRFYLVVLWFCQCMRKIDVLENHD